MAIRIREGVVRKVALSNDPYSFSAKVSKDCREKLWQLQEQKNDLSNKVSAKGQEINDLINRMAYQLFPKRFESVENVLRKEYLELQNQLNQLMIKISEKERDVIAEKSKNYPEECIKNDDELIQLRERLREKQQQINNLGNSHSRR